MVPVLVFLMITQDKIFSIIDLEQISMRTAQNNNGDEFKVTSDRLHRLAQRTATFRRRRKEYAGLFSKVGLMLLLLPLLMWQCKEDDFQGELVGICPEVIYTDPIHDTINVALNKQVSATFNETMNSAAPASKASRIQAT